MTISSSNARIQYSGNGATVDFATNFKLLDESHVKVILTSAAGVDTVQTITTHYTVSGVGGSTATITMVTAPATGETLTLSLNVPLTQTYDLVNGQAFNADTIETALDLGTQVDQSLSEKASRTLTVPESVSTSFSGELETVSANEILRINSSGDGFESVAATALGLDIALGANLTPTNGNLIVGAGTTWTTKTSDKFHLVHENVAAMVADTTLNAGDLVTTRGYTTEADGGHAAYVIQTAADYGGTPDEVGEFTLASGDIAKLVIGDSINLKQFGGACDGSTNDAAALTAALAFGKKVILPNSTVATLNAAQSLIAVDNLNLISPKEDSTLTIDGSEISVTGFLDLNNPDLNNLTLAGENNAALTVSAISETGSAKNHSVTYTVSDGTGISVGDYLLVSALTGTGDYKAAEGCFKVTAVSTNDITVKNTLNSTWPTMTVTGGTVKHLTSVLRWPANSIGMRIFGCSFKALKNVVLAGAFNITTTAAADSPDDGLQIGAAPNTTETGLNESEQTNSGSLWAQNVGIVEWEGNGVQVIGGNFYGSTVSACSNGWRGFQAANRGAAIIKYSSAVGNGASGYEVEAGGNMVANYSVAAGNGGQGFYNLYGEISGISAYALNNVGIGVEVLRNGFFLGDGATIKNNGGVGLKCTSAIVELGASATLSGNTTYDVAVYSGGIVDGTGASSLGTSYIDYDTLSNLIETGGDSSIGPSIQNRTNTSFSKISCTSLGDVILSSNNTGAGYVDLIRLKNTTGTTYPNTDLQGDLGRVSERWSTGYIQTLQPGAGTVKWTSGSGSPEGVVTAVVGSMYTRTDGGASTTLYVKESGTGNTGWVAK